MKEFFTATNVFESSRFIYFLMKICSYLFITIKKDENGKYEAKTSRFDLFRFGMFMLFGNYSFLNLLKQPFKSNLQITSIILQLGIHLKYRIIIFQPIISSVFALAFKNNFYQILKFLDDIDKKLKSFKVNRNFSSDMKWTIYFYIGILTYTYIIFALGLIPNVMMDEKHYEDIPMENPFFIYLVQIPGLINLVYCITFIAIITRFKSTIKVLKSEKNLNIYELKEIMKIHIKCFEIIHLNNQFFALNAFIGFTDFSASLTFVFFCVYSVYKSGFDFDEIMLLYGNFMYFIICAGYFYVILKAACNVRNLCNELWEIFCLKENFNRNENYLKFQQISIYQISYCKFIPSCGFYEFNWKVLMIVLSGAFTYLIVGIDFDK
ncbi:hypothetical protein PVAND_015377 [Polypedilum vanderplanki]|uniref:Gustatory receptor n=1 Tax=Polypedilum vanderplanki TaxID=319348 RepID=A0A9J6BC31_POLVA|nr:hypothetical protein PVAND_015377 [Polypedilum vanderplanki]